MNDTAIASNRSDPPQELFVLPVVPSLQISPNLEALLKHDELTRRGTPSPPPSRQYSDPASGFVTSLPPPPPRLNYAKQVVIRDARAVETVQKGVGFTASIGALPNTFPASVGTDTFRNCLSPSPAPSRTTTPSPLPGPNPYINPTPLLIKPFTQIAGNMDEGELRAQLYSSLPCNLIWFLKVAQRRVNYLPHTPLCSLPNLATKARWRSRIEYQVTIVALQYLICNNLPIVPTPLSQR